MFHSWCGWYCILCIICSGITSNKSDKLGFQLPLILRITNPSSVLNEQMDVWELRTPFLFLKWIGMNAMLVFVLGAQGILAGFVNGWYYKNPDYTLVSISNVLYFS